MRTVLVTTAKLTAAELETLVTADDDVVVVAPAVEQSRLQWLTNEEDDARDQALEIARKNATLVDGRSQRTPGAESPLQAVIDAVREHRPERVVVVVREGDDASWLENGELERIPGAVESVPVERVSLR